MKKYLSLLNLLLLIISSNVLADDILYTYCQMPEGHPEISKDSIVLLSYNLSSSEVSLYIKEDDTFSWLAGRKPERDSGFGGTGDIEQLQLALSLRNSVVKHHYVWIKTRADVNTYSLDNISLCDSTDL